jgi:uncharacterized membrane protein YphA (DoxX/SURF4 family)
MSSKLEIALKVARIVLGLLFLASGIFHFMNYGVMAVFVPLPWGSKYFVLLVATIISVCSVSIVLNQYTRASFLTIAIVFFLTGVMILLPTIHFSNDAYLKVIQLPNLYKTIIAFFVLLGLILYKPKQK